MVAEHHPPKLRRCQVSPSPPLLCSEIDFTLVGLETLARVFDPPVSPRSPVREQVSPTGSPQPPAAFGCHWSGGEGGQGSFYTCWHLKVLLVVPGYCLCQNLCSWQRGLGSLWLREPEPLAHHSGASMLFPKHLSLPSGSPNQRSRPGAAPQQDICCQPSPLFSGEKGV